MAMIEKCPKLSLHIKGLEVAMQSLKTLKASMPPAFASPISLLHDKLKGLIDSAAELNAFLTSIEEIKQDVNICISFINNLYWNFKLATLNNSIIFGCFCF